MNSIFPMVILLIVQQSVGAKVNITEKFSNTQGVLFRVNFAKKPHFTIPAECAKLDICEDVKDFPEDEINELINLLVARKVNFNQDRESIVDVHIDKTEGINLCPSNSVILRPKAVKVNDEWRLVLNSKYNMVQSFKEEICLGLYLPCSNLAQFVKGYEGRCVQKYSYRRMIVLSKNYEEVKVLYQAVPICCSCAAFKI